MPADAKAKSEESMHDTDTDTARGIVPHFKSAAGAINRRGQATGDLAPQQKQVPSHIPR